MRLTIQGSVDGNVMLTAAIKLSTVADNLAKADDMLASIGAPRETVLTWARKSLATQELAGDRAMSERRVATLLWLACRGHPTAAEIEAAAHQGGVLECDFLGSNEVFYFLTLPTGERVGTAPGSTAVY